MNLAQELVDRVAKQRKLIVVIGDTMTDVWVRGEVSDCQEGCPKLLDCTDSRVVVDGGAANAYASLHNWANVDKVLLGRAQNDRPIKYRFVDSMGKIVFRYDDETVLRTDNYDWCRSDALAYAARADAVLLSDYDKGFLREGFIREVVRVCQSRQVPCVADAKREPKLYQGAVLKGNYAWATKWWLTNKCVITRGGDNPLVSSVAVGPHLSPVQCVNHVGAGDCFAAHLTLALSYGFSLKDAAAVSHSAGRVYVQHQHNQPPQLGEILADMANVCASVHAS